MLSVPRIGGVDEARNGERTASLIGRRVHVIGNSCSGKSTLGERLAGAVDAPWVDLDAINWQPDWVGLNATDPDEFVRRIAEATAGDAFVVSGSYTRFCQQAFWDRLETLVWLDLPLSLLVRRVLVRSWRRWRSKELLWGTNRESFWRQLMVWRGEESLLWWIVTQHRPKRRTMVAYYTDPAWRHVTIVRLRSPAEVEAFAARLERGGSG